MFRIVAAILVVAIHTEPFLDQNAYVGFFASQVITRIAVPFFFCISGYYFYQGLQKGKIGVKDTAWRYFKYYGFWTLVYYVLDIVTILARGEKTIDWFSYIEDFFLFGSVYHFWYFVAIIVSVIVFGISYRIGITKWIVLISMGFYVFGVLSSSYFYLFENVAFFKVLHDFQHFVTVRRILFTGLPFFCVGFYVERLLELENNRRTTWKVMVFGGLFLVEIFGVKFLNLADNITITFGLYFLTIYGVVLLLKLPLSGYERIAKTCRGLATYIYCVHPMFIILLSYFGFYIHLNNFFKFSFILVVCLVTWFLLKFLNMKLNSKIIKRYIVDN